ncbi:hypothetical protein BD769DRAFT_154513 [Suillus cothurnatus]|nr:hypothetical protein BD769DRAFT_154513 [Suillus cothurnatus]
MLLAAVLNSFTAMTSLYCSKLCISGCISNPISNLISGPILKRISCSCLFHCISSSSISRNRSTLPMSFSRSDFEAICISSLCHPQGQEGARYRVCRECHKDIGSTRFSSRPTIAAL